MSSGFFRGWQHRRRGEVTLDTLPDLTGKVAIVTGANGGLGLVCSRELAKRGATIFLACRSKAKAESAQYLIRESVPSALLEYLPYDGSSLKSVEAAANKFLATGLPLHILLLNAGIQAPSFEPSAEGLESMFAVNHLAHFLLATLLLPAMEKRLSGPDVRIVLVSSAGHAMHTSSNLGLDDLKSKNGFTSNMAMYGRSKTCNILFASKLQNYLRGTGRDNILVNSCHPGTIHTNLNTSLRGSILMSWLEWLVYQLFSISQEEGAITPLYLCGGQEIHDRKIGGEYFTPYGARNSPGGVAANERLRELLWEKSITLCKGFDIPKELLD